MKRLIIFDFFGVISGEVAPKWFAKHIGGEKGKILKEKYIGPADNGEYTLKRALQMMADDLGYNLDDIISEWQSYAVLNKDLLEMIQKLHKSNTVALLSNASEGIFEMLFPTLDFSKYFDKYFLSYNCKMSKPDLKFYDLCVNSFDTHFDEIYFFDDNIKNIDCLSGTNIKGIQFIGNADILPILERML